ncbi:MAG: hypothetical protein JST58_18215 [Bacteroidetes bacterium]|nr:hypothetical protein [Bacteroidota bacterium]
MARTLSFDGKVWRTTQFSANGKIHLKIERSEELAILPMNAIEPFTISDFVAVGSPIKYTISDTAFVQINYKPSNKNNKSLPERLSIKYYIVKGEAFCRKRISLFYKEAATVDRLEVERFVVDRPAAGGGRGEPVFINDQWFFGLEYPAGYSRHTDGNTPKDYGRYFEKVGNYSYIDLEGRDIEPQVEKGMLRLMHFPGYAVEHGQKNFQIISKTAVAGVAGPGKSVTQAFMDYLSTIWKAPHSFLQFNNWFEPEAKNLKGDGMLNIWRSFKKAITPYGIKMDAMVADNGWQNTKSIWDPNSTFFPNGFDDVKLLSDKLKKEGVGFGLWLSLNGYTNNIDWGISNGYREAERNKYFEQYGRYYSLSATKYKNEMLKKIPFIVKKTGLVYFKHDFNELCDKGEGNNHPPTDRHGHEANLDAAIEILLAARKVNPNIVQNMTNWVWFSPWWLQYADYLWMLAGDDGVNRNWPEISVRAMASTDRDTYIWRMFGNPNDRPLVPISRLMTHGIIKTSTGMMESKDDNLQDWLEYVLMHYGRGTLLKEWYVSPSVMKPDEWKVLCTVHNWAKEQQSILNNTVFVGGRPDDGKAYGYMGWEGNNGILVVRNTRADSQKIIIPFDQSVHFYGDLNQSFKAEVVFPYQDDYPVHFISGKPIEIVLPGYATMAFEFSKGNPEQKVAMPERIPFATVQLAEDSFVTSLKVPVNVSGRCDLIVIGYPIRPMITVNGNAIPVKRSEKSKLNDFASYAKSGMINDEAKEWDIATYDLLPFAGKDIKISYKGSGRFESHLLAEQKVVAPKALTGLDPLWAITNDTRRQTIKLH